MVHLFTRHSNIKTKTVKIHRSWNKFIEADPRAGIFLSITTTNIVFHLVASADFLIQNVFQLPYLFYFIIRTLKTVMCQLMFILYQLNIWNPFKRAVFLFNRQVFFLPYEFTSLNSPFLLFFPLPSGVMNGLTQEENWSRAWKIRGPWCEWQVLKWTPHLFNKSTKKSTWVKTGFGGRCEDDTSVIIWLKTQLVLS